MSRVLGFGVLALALSGCAPGGSGVVPPVASSTMAVAWKQTAAEYDALYLQGFNVARARVEEAVAQRGSGGRPAGRPLAVITDLDDTIIDTRDYWRSLLSSGGDFFDDARWDAWVAQGRATATPGAREFLEFCGASGVAVFYITNRDQGDRTSELALAQLRAIGAPYADPSHLTVLRESSDKEPRQREIEATHDVVVYLGDNLNDFRRRFYVTDVEERRRLLADDRAAFGSRFVLFPNPTDGHWIRAIYGESEPPLTREHLDTLRRAAERR